MLRCKVEWERYFAPLPPIDATGRSAVMGACAFICDIARALFYFLAQDVQTGPRVSQLGRSLVASGPLIGTINAVRSKFLRPVKQPLLSRRLDLGARGGVSSFIYRSASQVKSTLALPAHATTFDILLRHPTDSLSWSYLECNERQP